MATTIKVEINDDALARLDKVRDDLKMSMRMRKDLIVAGLTLLCDIADAMAAGEKIVFQDRDGNKSAELVLYDQHPSVNPSAAPLNAVELGRQSRAVALINGLKVSEERGG